METSPPNDRFPQTPNSRFSTKKGRSGYEPSDTETEWQDIPRHERERKNLALGLQETKALTLMNQSPMALHRRHPSRFENEISSPVTSSVPGQLPRRKNLSKSPYKLNRADDDAPSPMTGLDTRTTSPLPRPDLERNLSPYKPEREKLNRRNEQRTPSRQGGLGLLEVDRVTEKPNYRRAVTAPRLRMETEQQSNYGQTMQNGGRTLSPLSKGMILKQREASASHLRPPSVGEINEMIAEAKLSKNPTADDSVLESTESIQPGDIFFSRESNALRGQKSSLPKNIQQANYFSSRPTVAINPMIRGTPSRNENRGNGQLNINIRSTSSSNVSAATSRKGSGKLSASSGVNSESSGKTSASMRKFTANRKKNQNDHAWFACMRKGHGKTEKSPKHRSVDEASFIERALVVESLPQFWADKHQPASLNGFICNKQEAQLLKELVSQGRGISPHILLKGPSGSGKRELAMALLREIYGDACCNVSHDLRVFPIQERRPMKVSVPITSSPHHMELNVNLEPNAKYALIGLIKEISNVYSVTPEVSNINFKSDYKVLLLYEVEKAVDNIQHMIKWIIERYSDICKLVLCCEEDTGILESVKARFKVIKVVAPQAHEITEVLIQISKKEDIDLSKNFAVKIATKSKQNLRKAIMALEACKAHNYPFSEEQPIPVGWEEIIIEVAAEILADPTYSRLLSIRGKFQTLLMEFVHPKLILLKLVEQLLKGIDASLKREIYYWHAYYDKRLPPGTTALLKLEEFVAKFMSIYRKSSSSRQYE